MPVISPPARPTSSTVSLLASTLMSHPTTFAPSRAKVCAATRPRPPPVPVISTTFLSSIPISALLVCGGQLRDDGILDCADALDLDSHPLSGSQKPSGEHTDAAGCPRGDKVAGFQR